MPKLSLQKVDILPSPCIALALRLKVNARTAQGKALRIYPALEARYHTEQSKIRIAIVMRRLEAEDLVLELADWPCLLVSQALGGLLERRDHGRGTAHEDLDIGCGCGELSLDHVGGDETHAAVPLLRRVVQDIVYPELGVFGRDSVNVLLEQDILWVDVGEDEIDLGLVACCAAAQDCLDDLEHGRDTSATRDHAKVSDEVGGVDHGALGTANLDCLTNSERGDVLGDVTGGV